MRYVFLVLLLLAVPGCGSLNAKYIEADRAKYEAIAPEYLLYVDADKALDDDDKKIRRHNILMWRIRIEEAEKFLNLHRKKDSESIWDGWEPW